MEQTNNWKTKFAVIFVGQAFSIIGSAVVQFAIVWYLTITTESAMVLSLSLLFAFLPNAIFGPFAGVLIDRFNRKTVMMVADGFVALTSIILGVALLDGNATPAFMYFILFLRGLGNTFHSPAMQATIPMLAPSSELEKVGGWASLIDSGANMVGPVMGALLMNTLPIAAIMIVDIAGASLAILCLFFVKVPDVARDEERQSHLVRNVIKDLKEGLKELYHNKPLFTLSLPVLLAMLAYMPLAALFPLLVRTHFGGGALHDGIVEFMFALGLMVSSILMGVKGGMKNTFLMISLAILALGGAAAIGGALPPHLYIVFVMTSFVMGFAATYFSVPFMAYIQRTTSEANMGKVMSLCFTVMSLATPIGLLVTGPITEAIGVDRWFMICGILMILCSFLCYGMTRRFAVEEIAAKEREEEKKMQEAQTTETR